MPQADSRSTIPKKALLDPVVAGAVQLADLWDRFNALDRIDSSQKAYIPNMKIEMDDVIDRTEVQVDILTTLHARTIPGALVHAELVASAIRDIAERHEDNFDTKRELVRINRLLYSVMDVLREHAAGVEPLGKIYVCDGQNPWKPDAKLEAVIKGLEPGAAAAWRA